MEGTLARPAAGTRRLAAAGVERLRRRGRKAVLRALRLTAAAVAAWLVARRLEPATQPVLAPLTALLVVQVTLRDIVASGIRRVVSVVVGVGVAILFASVVGFTWWSLGLLVAASIVVGQLLRLGDHVLEVPISAMLVLAVGGAETAATTRILQTVIGAVVGVAANVLVPPAVQGRDAVSAFRAFVEEIAALLERMGGEVAAGASETQAVAWLDDARRLGRHVGRVDTALHRAGDSRRLNPRAVGRPDEVPALRSGLDALEHASVSLRGLCRSILDRIRERPEGAGGDSEGEVAAAFGVLLDELAAAVRAYGSLVVADTTADMTADTTADTVAAAEPKESGELATALDTLREARARLTELLLVDPRADQSMWQLNGSMLADVERVLRELDIEERARLRERRRRELAERPRAAQAVDRIWATTRQVATAPVTLRPRRRGYPRDRVAGAGSDRSPLPPEGLAPEGRPPEGRPPGDRPRGDQPPG